MPYHKAQLGKVVKCVEAACAKAGRNSNEVTLVAVSKTVDVARIKAAYDLGCRDFGESRLQEAEQKIAHMPFDVVWHFIGRIQRNKVRKILAIFPILHAVDSLKLAAYIDDIAAESSMRPRIFLQVNLTGESTKGGFAESQLRSEMRTILELKHLDVIGLMCIPENGEDPEIARAPFRDLKNLKADLEKIHDVELPFLSMGMSNDYEIAIEEGSTHIRVGSAIFGDRSERVLGELG